MRLLKFVSALALSSIFWTGILSSPPGPVFETMTVSTNLQMVQTVVPNQQLQPGQIKHPGEKCATLYQPPEYQGCPGPKNNMVNGQQYCVGSLIQIGDCLAGEQGFFGFMQPRNSTEACIFNTENGNSYDRSSNPTHFGRDQFSYPLWVNNGGIAQNWGYASPAEQDRVFVQTVAFDGGYGPWINFDGC